MEKQKDKNTENEKQKLKEDTERMRMHYGMLLDHHIIDFDMFENKVGKENVPKILQEYNKILMKGELAEYEPDFIGICHHNKVDCALKELCPVGFKCNHEHEHSNAKMCYMNKPGGELETFLLKNNTSVPKLLEMERTIAETKQEELAKRAFSAYDIPKQDSGKLPPITSYGECTHPNRKCECRKDGKCPDAQMAIQFCRSCSDEDLQKADEFAKALPHALKQIAEPEERVNHPRHYQHPSGVECITVARHHDFNTGSALKYLWRAGLKQEQGLTPLDKQIEDLQKAVFCIQDEIKFLQAKQQ